jgi:hypothetical protein
MLSDDGLFEKTMAEALHFNMNTLRCQNPKDYKPHHPVSFYDRHLDTKMILKHIEINPSIPQFLFQLCKNEVKDFLDAGHSLEAGEFSTFKPFQLRGGAESSETGLHYSLYVSRCCYSITSRIFFHPNYPSSGSVFSFAVKSVEGPGTKFLAEGSLSVDIRLTNPPDQAKPVPLFEKLDESTTSRLKDLAMHSARLAIWELYAMTPPAHKLLRSIQTSDFKWDKSHIRGVPPDPHCSQVPKDANTILLRKIHQVAPLGKRTTTTRRTASNPLGSTRTSCVKVAPALPYHANVKGRPYRPDPSHYLQRASTASFDPRRVLIYNHTGMGPSCSE